jgi:hypothetical protein
LRAPFAGGHTGSPLTRVDTKTTGEPRPQIVRMARTVVKIAAGGERLSETLRAFDALLD